MQLNEVVRKAISLLSEIRYFKMTPFEEEEAWNEVIELLEDGLQLMQQEQKPVAWIDVKPNPFDPSCRGAASVQDHALPQGEHKLYAAPKLSLQPLTDKEIAKAWSVANGEHNASASVKSRITRAIEAAVSNQVHHQLTASMGSMNKQKCSAITDHKCKNGFSVAAACHGISADKVLPMCCKEEVCGRLFEHNGGKPKAHIEVVCDIK